MTQLLGSGLGHIGSTSKRGAVTISFFAAAWSSACALNPSASSTATIAPARSVRFTIASLLSTARQELLHALAFERLARIDVAARIHGHAPRRVERARPSSAAADLADHGQRVALHDGHMVIVAVRDE